MELRNVAELLYRLAHDLSAPVRAIRGFGQALREDTTTGWTSQCDHHLERILVNAARLESLQDRLALLARAMEPPRLRQTVDVDATFADTFAKLQQRGGRVRAETGLQGVVLRDWDPGHARVLAEALYRHAEAVAGTTVSCTLIVTGRMTGTTASLEARVAFGSQRNVSEATLATSRPTVELAIAQILLQHYPLAQWEPALPDRVRFYFSCAAVAGEGQVAAEGGRFSPSADSVLTGDSLSRVRTSARALQGPIMLVDDDPAEWELLQLVIEDSGLEQWVEWYRDGKLALERLEQLAANPAGHHGWLPVVVFADLRMPTLDGISLVRMIRSRDDLSAVPVVLLSSSDNPDEIRAAYAAGANAFVTKPTDFHFYAECLHLALAFWGRCNRVAWGHF
ncbi:MAG: hypothetical protein KatS3mg077_0219 [Candidatus Binatia bacterium]|nr:MAG: hypothetical protein KatS3mg077_0219 [Candidatus Binatia bacterium]